MRIFLTGATGWIGTAIAEELLGAGHGVNGLARTPEKAAALLHRGVEPVEGTLDDLDVLRDAANDADAVIHTAFNHDFSRFAENAEQDRRAIEAIGEALAGSDKTLIVTSGVALLAPGRVAVEADMPPLADPGYPRRSEAAAQAAAAQEVRVSTIRLAPTVHGTGETHGFVPMLIRLARESGVSAYPGDGANRWPAVHVADAGRLYRLVLEQGAPAPAFHGVAEEGIAFRDIAEAIGRGLNLPVEPRGRDHFGWFADFAAADMAASSERTRELTGWSPAGPTLMEDLAKPDYFRA